MKSFVSVVLGILAFGSTARAQETGSPVLDKLMIQFVEAFDARDMKTLASLYADDAVWMPPNAPMVKGRPAIEAVFTTAFTGPGVLKLTANTSQIAGGFGFSAGTYTFTVPTDGGGTQTIAAKYLTVFKRVGNEWKIAYDMQNADQPPAPR